MMKHTKDLVDVKINLPCKHPLHPYSKNYIRNNTKSLGAQLKHLQQIYVVCAIFNNKNLDATKQRSAYIEEAIKQIKVSYELLNQSLLENSLGLLEAKAFIYIEQALDYVSINQHIFCIASDGKDPLSPSNVAWLYQPETVEEPGRILLRHDFNLRAKACEQK